MKMNDWMNDYDNELMKIIIIMNNEWMEWNGMNGMNEWMNGMEWNGMNE